MNCTDHLPLGEAAVRHFFPAAATPSERLIAALEIARGALAVSFVAGETNSELHTNWTHLLWEMGNVADGLIVSNTAGLECANPRDDVDGLFNAAWVLISSEAWRELLVALTPEVLPAGITITVAPDAE